MDSGSRGLTRGLWGQGQPGRLAELAELQNCRNWRKRACLASVHEAGPEAAVPKGHGSGRPAGQGRSLSREIWQGEQEQGLPDRSCFSCMGLQLQGKELLAEGLCGQALKCGQGPVTDRLWSQTTTSRCERNSLSSWLHKLPCLRDFDQPAAQIPQAGAVWGSNYSNSSDWNSLGSQFLKLSSFRPFGELSEQKWCFFLPHVLGEQGRARSCRDATVPGADRPLLLSLIWTVCPGAESWWGDRPSLAT